MRRFVLRPVRPLASEDLAKVIDEIGEYAPLVVFATESGLRPCEWIALERRDVDRTGKRVYIEREHVEDVTKPYGKTVASRRCRSAHSEGARCPGRAPAED